MQSRRPEILCKPPSDDTQERKDQTGHSVCCSSVLSSSF